MQRENEAADSAAAVNQWIQGRLADMLDYRARLELASRCERRDPFLDEQLIEFAASVPPAAFLYGDDTRGLFRASLAGTVPDGLRLRRDKSQFTTALMQIVRANIPALRDLATLRYLGHFGWVDRRAYRRDFERQLSAGDHGRWLSVWPALAVEAFLRSRADVTSGLA